MPAAIARSSSGSLYRRSGTSSEKETDYFLDIDRVNHVALVTVVNHACQPTIVGGGRYAVSQPGQSQDRVRDHRRVLRPQYRLSGREAGLRELVAEVLSENVPMLNISSAAASLWT